MYSVILIIPVNLICHITMLEKKNDPQGTPEPQAPPLASERERSGRVLDSRPRGRGFEPHLRHCVVVPENHKNIGFSSITGQNLLKLTKLQSQHSMWAIIGLPAKRHFKGVSRFSGRPIIACSWWFLEPRSPRKNKTTEKTYQS